jgi:hypothetical protein
MVAKKIGGRSFPSTLHGGKGMAIPRSCRHWGRGFILDVHPGSTYINMDLGWAGVVHVCDVRFDFVGKPDTIALQTISKGCFSRRLL